MSQMLNSSQVLSKSFEQLSKKELYAILALRIEVFCVEQNCPYQDIDDQDINAQHLFIKQGDVIMAYARIITENDHTFHIGRVVVDEKFRKHKLATKVMQSCIETIKEQAQTQTTIVVSAQSYLQDFYRGLGFNSTDNYYLEDDIPHERMHLLLS